jgi:hypothetical protein
MLAQIILCKCNAPTAEEKIFWSISPAQGVLASLSRSTLSGKMPKNCTGSHTGQLHCLAPGRHCVVHGSHGALAQGQIPCNSAS